MVFALLILATIWAGSVEARFHFYLVDSSGRLSTAGEGLLLYNGGTVCDDGFDDVTAETICRLMGYRSVSSWKNTGNFVSNQNNYPIRLDDVTCSGDTLPSCRYLTSHNCGHGEDVWLACTPYPPTCSPGHYRESHSTCTPCPENTYSATLHDQQQCLKCPLDSMSGRGASSCVCPAGSFWDKGSQTCELCKENYYTPVAGASECVRCPLYTVSQEGATLCNKCQVGYEWSNYSCAECPAGHVSAGLQCNKCPDGSSPSDSRALCEKFSHARLEMLAFSCLVAFSVLVVVNIAFILQQRVPQGHVRGAEREPPREETTRVSSDSQHGGPQRCEPQRCEPQRRGPQRCEPPREEASRGEHDREHDKETDPPPYKLYRE